MPGRGDNNKNGSSGQGASSQSNQPLAGDDKTQPESNHGKKTGGEASKPQAKTGDTSAHRDAPKKRTNHREETW